jgi:chemotaxis protein methyltransferase CheR
VSGVTAPRTPSPEDRLRRLLEDRTGLDLSGARGGAFEAALARAERASPAARGEPLAEALLAGRAPLEPLVEELTVGETWFFRDPAQWAFVEETVIPEVRRRRRGGEPLRAWSAGCATGEEAYSLAIVLLEAGLGDALSVLGTDVNETALSRARAGEFSLWSLRGDVGARARRYLREEDGKLHVAPALAAHVRFFALNLASGDYPSPSRGLADLDLVLCRNVLIYLRRDRVPEIAARLFASLAPGGWLLAGASDPVLARHAPFELHAGPHGIAYRRPAAGGRARAPSGGRREVPGALRPVARVAAARRRAPVHPPPPARALLDAGRPVEALAAIDAALARRPLAPETHFERAVALTELGRLDAAEDACRRALYLARGQPFVHFFLGMLRRQRGDPAGAARAFRTAAVLASRRAPDAEVPLSHGMTAGALADAARVQLALAGDGPGAARR